MEFKRVSAATQCCWGIACDNQVYLYVCSSDVPIRHREEAYENQRWNPVGGFCEKLLPSDRWSWSDVSGLRYRPLDGVALPSPHWEWESDWYVDENFGGEPTEKGVGELSTSMATFWAQLVPQCYRPHWCPTSACYGTKHCTSVFPPSFP